MHLFGSTRPPVTPVADIRSVLAGPEHPSLLEITTRRLVEYGSYNIQRHS